MIDSSDDSGDEKVKPNYSEETSSFECDLCDKFYARKDNLIIHLYQKHTKKHQCSQGSCQNCFVSRSDLEAHLKTHDEGKIEVSGCW
jgi:Zinc finger, C2H2 type